MMPFNLDRGQMTTSSRHMYIHTICVYIWHPSLTSFDPDVLAELGGHAHQEGLTLRRDSFMKVVTTAAGDL